MTPLDSKLLTLYTRERSRGFSFFFEGGEIVSRRVSAVTAYLVSEIFVALVPFFKDATLLSATAGCPTRVRRFNSNVMRRLVR
jgi:hypothetical protein